MRTACFAVVLTLAACTPDALRIPPTRESAEMDLVACAGNAKQGWPKLGWKRACAKLAPAAMSFMREAIEHAREQWDIGSWTNHCDTVVRVQGAGLSSDAWADEQCCRFRAPPTGWAVPYQPVRGCTELGAAP